MTRDFSLIRFNRERPGSVAPQARQSQVATQAASRSGIDPLVRIYRLARGLHADWVDSMTGCPVRMVHHPVMSIIP